MTRSHTPIALALLATSALVLPPSGADAFSSFKGRYQKRCPETRVTACPSSPASAPPGRPANGHVLEKSTHNTVIEIEEGYGRTLTATCKNGEWQIDRNGFCGDWDLDVGSWGSCSASCGGGSQSRSVSLTCEQPSNGGPDNAGTAPDAACNSGTRPTEPISSRSCNNQACSPPPSNRGDGPSGAGFGGDDHGVAGANDDPNGVAGGGIGGTDSASDGDGGDGGSSCFHPDTPVLMADGTARRIAEIAVGDRLQSGARVTATGRFLADDLYWLDGVRVTGGHAVRRRGRWQRVRDLPEAVRVLGRDHKVVNLASEDHRIEAGGLTFADFLETGGVFAAEIFMEARDAARNSVRQVPAAAA